MDLRLPVSVTCHHKTHRRSVLCVAAIHNYVYSGSEDKNVCVWDVRKQEMLEQISVSVCVGGCVAMSLCVCVGGMSICW